MKILIIGGTGLISTAITQQLVKRGDDVTHFNRGHSQPALPAGEKPARVKQILGDRTDYPAFGRQMAELGPFDVVMDMVGFAPGDDESVVRAFAGRIGQFIFCSTVDVYQKPALRYPIREDFPRGGLNDYARNKTVIEKTLEAAHAHGDFPVTILRAAYTYGEGRGMLNPIGGRFYLDRIRRGRPIVVHGDGSSLWSSCHRDDAARAFIAAASNPETYGKAYHTPGHETMTWNRYHEEVALALDAPPPTLVHIPIKNLVEIAPAQAASCADNFQFHNIFDVSAAVKDLEFAPKIDFQEGVKRVVQWLEAHGGLGNSDDDDFDDRLIAAWHKAETTMTGAF